MINKSNYEAFALDYLEGNLSATERQAMKAFLQEHPAIAEELLLLEDMVTLVPDESVVFDNKNALLKSEGGARVIAMHQRTWFRTMIAAAAMLLLIGGYLAGYFSKGMDKPTDRIVKTPEVEDSKSEVIKKEATIELEEAVATNNEKEELEKEVVKKEVTPKNTATQKNNTAKNYEAVANSSSEKPKATPKKSVLPPTIMEKNIPQKEEEVIVVEENLPKEPVKIPEPKVVPEIDITIPTLPKEEVAIQSIPPTKALEEIITDLPNPNAVADNSEEEQEEVTEKKSKKTLRKISRFFGKLPFEGATASIIPTYYTDKKKGREIK